MSSNKKVDAARLRDVKRDDSGALLLTSSTPDDALAGVVSERALLLSKNSKGHRVRQRTKSWHWLPNGDPEILVHGDGWTTAHPGSLAADARPDDEPIDEEGVTLARARAAGLTGEELAVAEAQARRLSYVEIAAKLGWPIWKVHARVKTGRAKYREHQRAIKEMR